MFGPHVLSACVLNTARWLCLNGSIPTESQHVNIELQRGWKDGQASLDLCKNAPSIFQVFTNIEYKAKE